MPEGDTVLRTARGLDRALTGDVLTVAQLRWGRLGEIDLTGREVLGSRSYGKHILTRLGAAPERPELRFPTGPQGSVTVHSHLRMDGSWRIRPVAERVPGHGAHRIRAVLGTENWTALGNLLGMLDVLPTDREHDWLGRLGPDVMADDWTEGTWRESGRTGREEAIARLTAAPDIPIGAALLDQRITAGIGTFYMAEALFVQHLSPWVPAGEVDPGLVMDTARRQLLRGAEQLVPNTTGDTRPRETSFVHSRSGRPCRRCGTIVRVAPVREPPTQRPAFYCPQCQPGPTPTDTGGRMTPLGSAPHRLGSTRNQGLRPPTSGWLG